MAGLAGTHYPYVNSLAAYKDALKPFSDALNTLFGGRTADTGQIDWDTVPNQPGTAVRDYEVFAFPGALQATKPLFLRVDYRNSSSTPQFWLTVGTGTDGAGNITGVVAGPFNIAGAAANAVRNWYVALADDGSYLTIIGGINFALLSSVDNGSFAAAVERFRDPVGSGDPVGDGFYLAQWTGMSWAGMTNRYTYDGAPAQPSLDWEAGVVVPRPSAGSAFYGDTTYAFPLRGMSPRVMGPSAAAALGFQGDWPRYSEIDMPVYGGPARWFSLGSGGLHRAAYMSSLSASTTATLSPLIRID